MIIFNKRYFLSLFFVFLLILSTLLVYDHVYATTLFSDDFNRSDADSLGPNWIQSDGTSPVGISNNKAYISTGAGGNLTLLKVKDLNSQDTYVTATFTHQPGDTGIVARFQDLGNRVFAGFGSPDQDYNQITFGYAYQGMYHYFWPNTFSANWGQTYTFELIVIGKTVTLKIDGQTIDTEQMTNTWSGTAGFYANDGYTKVLFDNFYVTIDGITSPVVDKIYLIPGLGASWNAYAFASCSFDPDPNNWTLASYASDIYSPLIDQIKNTDRDLKEFYYDWKAQIQNNSNALAGFIDSSNLTPDEKIDIVGHSMGGLIGMDYLLESTNKVNGLLTVGSPFKGSALAYPAWEGGDVWNDNFLAKIAITLYVKHCGNVLNTNTDKETIHRAFPSIGDLLPKFNYLNNFKTGASVYPLYAQNTWFNSVFAIPNGVKVETISGVGFNTLSNIAVKPANKRESDLELWQDGKPSGKQYSTEGDGTVLATSSQLEGAENITLTKTHSELVSSQDGINEILNFLGLPQTQSGTLSEPTSALIIIGYPSNFWITDQNGRTQKDKDGMVSFMNPKSGSFKLNVLPKSNKTLFVVAQFLPNGDVKYKEYIFDGFAPKFKTLKFDLQNPTENILD